LRVVGAVQFGVDGFHARGSEIERPATSTVRNSAVDAVYDSTFARPMTGTTARTHTLADVRP
jgi:hypothetical protein